MPSQQVRLYQGKDREKRDTETKTEIRHVEGGGERVGRKEHTGHRPAAVGRDRQTDRQRMNE